MSVAIDIRNAVKMYGSNTVIDNLNLSVREGEFFTLLGPSGCGKTTLLRMIAGFNSIEGGDFLFNGLRINDLDPAKRKIGMVFQNYAIFPHMTVRKNVAFGLENMNVPKAERNRRVAEYLELMQIDQFADRMPERLSGGQQQRVALARALVISPDVLLMDEPLSNLDAKLRVQMRSELIELHNKLKTTFVYVTHDQVEAMSMADTIVLMNNGEIQQQASPEEIYEDPNNVFTAQFIGTPAMNILPMPNGCFMGFRPEKTLMSEGWDKAPSAAYHTTGRIITREMLGSETLYKVQISTMTGEQTTVMVKLTDGSIRQDSQISLDVEQGALFFFDKDTKRIRESQRAEEYAACMRLIRGE